MKKGLKFFIVVLFAGAALSFITITRKVDRSEAVTISVPAGFKTEVFAEGLGRARHLVVNSNGDIFVKLETLRNGKGIIRLRDKNKDGVADDSFYFGNYTGTGIAIKNGYLYASSDEDIYRYKLTETGDVQNPDAPETVVKGLFKRGRHHSSKSIALDNNGNIYVNIGAPSNICQETQGSKQGTNPCPLLEKSGGIWQFKADKLNQTQADGVRFATGLRNVVGLDWNKEVNELYVMQHGRDLLFQDYPQWYDQKAGAENPAEEMFRIKKGGNYGWPYCYYDNDKKAKLLNPEYGGNREKAEQCATMDQSVAQFPGHMAPNALLFYTGNLFPEKYKNGAFIAFHGSWNRTPEPQAGYFVVFVPMKNGVPSGKWEVFAEGFAGENINRATHRPCGLAQAPDGSIYVSDDNKGNVWRISYAK
jgi:glucose/arabinose dehydrogenase